MWLFNWSRLLLGDTTPWYLLEIGLRVIVMYALIVIVLRFMDKRGMRHMTSVDYAIVIDMGSAAGDSMFYPDIPLTWGSSSSQG